MTLALPRRALIVPGRGEAVRDLRALLATVVRFDGIAFDERFAHLGFAAQVARVSALIAGVPPDETLLVGRSFGAWLVLHALLGRAQGFDGTVLLVAPVLGYGTSGRGGFVAPRARTFWASVEAGRAMPAARVVIIAGTADEQCPVELARRLGTWWPIELHECAVQHGLDAWTSTDMAGRIEAALRGDSTCA
jgi:pimeloyl-ACP methyl ester carboxylesterase